MLTIRQKAASVLLVGLLVGSTSACSSRTEVTSLHDKLNSTEAKLKALEADVKSVRAQLWRLEAKSREYESITLDPATKGFQRLDTEDGTFLVMLDDIKPYANGYRVWLSVGNPLSATYQGFKVHVEWGTSIDKADLEKGEWPQHKADFGFTETLRAGSWNKIVLPLTPAKPEEIEYISVSMETPRLSLLREK